MGQLSNYTNTFTAGTRAKSSEVNQNFSDIKNAHNDTDDKAFYKNGSKALTGNLDVGNNRITNLGDATSGTDAVSKDYVVGQIFDVSAKGYIYASTSTNSIDVITPNTSTATAKFLSQLNSTTTWETLNNFNTERMPTISNNVSDANNDIDISTGLYWDDTNATIIKLDSGLTKKLDASFVEGTNQGGLNTGSKAINAKYHLFLIMKEDRTTDVMFTTWANRATLPSGFVYKKWIGAILTDGSGNIIPQKQYDDKFLLNTSIVQYSATSGIPTSPADLTLSVPDGIKLSPILSIIINKASALALTLVDKNSGMLFSPAQVTSGVARAIVCCGIMTNTNSQIQHYANTSTATDYAIGLVGYKIDRGSV